MAIIRIKGKPQLPGYAPRISSRLPTPAAAFAAGSVTPQGWYDPGLRGFMPASLNGTQGTTPIGVGIRPPQNNSPVYLKNNILPLDLDAGSSCTAVFTLFIQSGGTFTGPHISARLIYGSAGSRALVQFVGGGSGAGGLQLLWPSPTSDQTEILVAQNDAIGRVFTVVLSAKDDEFLAFMNGRLIKQETYVGKSWVSTADLLGYHGGAGSGTEGVQYTTQGALWFGQHDADWLERLSRGPEELWEPQQIWVPRASAGGAPYSLTAEGGSYALNGQAAGLSAGRVIAADAGAYSLTGQDAGLSTGAAANVSLTADAGAYTLNGQSAGLLAARSILAAAGSYALTGQAAVMTTTRTIGAEAGAYSLSGQDAALLASRALLAGQGSYTLTGQAASLIFTPAGAFSLSADAGSYVLTGQPAGLLAARSLVAAQGSYSLSGQDAALTYAPASASYSLTADFGSYALNGQPVGFVRTIALAATAGTYTLAGQAASLLFSGAPPPTVKAAISARRMLDQDAPTRRPAIVNARRRGT